MTRGFDGGVMGHVRTLFELGAVGSMSDGQLLDRFLDNRGEGGRAAFGMLVERHGPMVLGACRRILREPADSEDAFQATFLVLAQRARAIRNRDSLGAWLFGVARKVSLRSRGQAARRRALELGSNGTRQEPSTDTSEEAGILIEEVGRLPERLREPVVLFYLQGQSYERAARSLRTTEGAIRGRLARARDLLRARLSDRGFSAGLLAPGVRPWTSLPPVPARLVGPTVRAAARITGGLAVSDATSPSIALLMNGAFKTMLTTKLKMAALAAGFGLMSLGLGLHVQAQQKPGGTAKVASSKLDDQDGPEIPAELVGGRVVRSAEVTRDCMVLSYLPDWAFGNVDNIGVASNDGGVRTLVDWADIPAAEAKADDRKFYLAFFSRKTTSKPKPGSILGFELSSEWPERTSWKTKPPSEPEPALTAKFEPGEGWKLFDITPHVREKQGKSGNGLMLRFLSEDRPGGGDWSGYEFVSREGQGEWAKRRPLLLVVEPSKK